jgi:hypothetical protein
MFLQVRRRDFKGAFRAILISLLVGQSLFYLMLAYSFTGIFQGKSYYPTNLYIAGFPE